MTQTGLAALQIPQRIFFPLPATLEQPTWGGSGGGGGGENDAFLVSRGRDAAEVFRLPRWPVEYKAQHPPILLLLLHTTT